MSEKDRIDIEKLMFEWEELAALGMLGDEDEEMDLLDRLKL